MNLPEVLVDPSIRARLAAGHPWVYRNHVSREPARVTNGSWVRVRCGGFSAIGLWDTSSPIALRIFSASTVPDAEWVAERVWEAWDGRASLREAGQTNAYRWLYGEGDGLPGMVVDRYGDYAIMQTYAPSLQTLVPLVATALRRCDPDLRGLVLRERPDHEVTDPDEERDADPAAPAPRLRLLWGELPPPDLVVQEHGLFFHADLHQGQKTGLFLDHRENRRMIEALAGGRSVLNCFAYTGGFSLYALRGGAAEVISNDLGKGLAEAASANLALNRLDPRRHQFVTDDSFSLLDSYARTGRRFQLIILDPPSFARQKRNLHAATRAYTRLNALALRCLEPGGLLATASCTSQISPELFRNLLTDAATQAGVRLLISHEVGQPVDHPVPVAFPEGRYLKFILARSLPRV
ncbi:MAG: class I SAM-dependent rRNA methyltransferase [Oscillochloridaceae bacterium umkhey_bin13]